MDIQVNVTVNYPKDDFYLQWYHIYWWYVKFQISNYARKLIKVEL